MYTKKMKQLEEQFIKISEKGYIKGIYNCCSSIGRTFENELNLDRNKKSVPDYYGIEIKTRRTHSKSFITLFNAVPNGNKSLELERIKNSYGYPYKKDKQYKALYADVYGNKLKFAGIKYRYKLDVDYIQEKIYLCVYSKDGTLIEREVYWEFDYLKNKLIVKLTHLAVVNALTNQIDGWNYFKYYKIDFYELKNFKVFLNLLEKGIIKLTLKIDIYTDKLNYGKTYDHGCGFCIKEENLDKLFIKIDDK